MRLKHSRDLDADDARSDYSSTGAGEQVLVFARANDRDRRTLNKTTSWRYHPRPRGLVCPQLERCMGSAAAAATAAAVPPSWLKSSGGADQPMRAAGVRGGSITEAGSRMTR